MAWTAANILGYHDHMAAQVPVYDREIDCADLALLLLVRYAAQSRLVVRFRYYAGGRWQAYRYAPGDEAERFARQVMIGMGALSVIDNTVRIDISQAKAGDLIMSRWSTTLGHTRVIVSVTPQEREHNVVWYQGNLPPVVPERREALFSVIEGVYENRPRRWNFASFM